MLAAVEVRIVVPSGDLGGVNVLRGRGSFEGLPLSVFEIISIDVVC